MGQGGVAPGARAEGPGDGERLGWMDWAGLALLTGILVTLCLLRSRMRLMWSDETYSFTLLREGSLTRALRGWWDGADGGGLWYYVLGTGWLRLFGATVLSLRLFSMVALAGGCALIWRSGRRFYAAPVMAIAIALVVLLPDVLSWQAWNGRFYGLFFFGAAWSSSVFLREMSREGESARGSVETGLSNLCLVGAHVLGVLYSGVLVAGMVAGDCLLGRRPRWTLYGAGVVSWLLAVISFHAVQATTGIAKGVFWTKKPRLADVARGLFLYSRFLFAIAVGLALLLLVLRLLRGSRPAPERARRDRRPVALLIASLGMAQICLFLVSQRGVSLYADRYLLPMGIAATFLLAELLTRVWAELRTRNRAEVPTGTERSRPVLAAGFVVLVVMLGCAGKALREQKWAPLYPRAGLPAELAAMLPAGEPVAVTMVPVFTLERLLDRQHHYIFLTDWEYDQDSAHPRVDLSMQRLMQNWRKGGVVGADSVVNLPEMEAQHGDFVVIAEPDRRPWIEERFGHDPGRELQLLGTETEWYSLEVWKVHKR